LGARRQLPFAVGTLLPGEEAVVTYRARVGVGSQRGDGINRAQARSGLGTLSNRAAFAVAVDSGVFSDDACVVGVVYYDCNENGVKEGDEPGVAGARLLFSDGAYMISDPAGRYSFCGRPPRTQVLRIDERSLPAGARLGLTSNRNAGNPSSLFVDLKNGELHRADFRLLGCPRQGGETEQ